MSGWLYLVVAIGLVLASAGTAGGSGANYSDALATQTFRFSLIHLSVLFAALLVDTV
jgi:protoheme IX farnesyltransferase